MKNITIHLTIFLFLAASYVGAQTNIVVLSTNASDGIEYEPRGGQARSVYPGNHLQPDGQLYLLEGRTVSLVTDGKKISITGPRTVPLATILQQVGETPGSTFLGRFWNFISGSVTNTRNTQEVEKYHRRHMTNTRAGISGYTKRGEVILIPLYFRGVISTAEIDLRWQAPDSVGTFVLRILEGDSEKEILMARTRDNRMRLSLADLNLSPTKNYIIRVSGKRNGERVESPTLFFSYQPGSTEEFTRELTQRTAFGQLDRSEQSIYSAMAFEDKDHFLAAKMVYEGLMTEQPDNELYQKLYAAFLARMDDLATANQLIH